MKAIVITRLGGPEVLELREVPEPVADLIKSWCGSRREA